MRFTRPLLPLPAPLEAQALLTKEVNKGPFPFSRFESIVFVMVHKILKLPILQEGPSGRALPISQGPPSGAGARGPMRDGEFSTDALVGPVTTRDCFSVQLSPAPIKELSVYGHIDMAHLNGDFRALLSVRDVSKKASTQTPVPSPESSLKT